MFVKAHTSRVHVVTHFSVCAGTAGKQAGREAGSSVVGGCMHLDMYAYTIIHTYVQAYVNTERHQAQAHTVLSQCNYSITM